MSESDLALLRRYMTLIIAEYERIGITAEMARYFTGSADGPFTEAMGERELSELRGMPSGIGFEAYCARGGMNANEIRATLDLAELS